MPYKLADIHPVNIPNLTELLNKPIEIYKAFIRMAGTRISSGNFNRYGAVTNLNLEIRLNVERERTLVAALQRTANSLASDNVIQPCRIALRDWNAPNFVVSAHETATKCAVAFKEEINANQQSLTALLRNTNDFMWKFMIALLRGADFRPQIIWGLLREQIEIEIQSVADACSPVLRESIGETTPTGDYMERFVHCFYNCTLSNEQQLINSLQISNIWQNLADSRAH